jgi:Tfp pilus assembly protein PilF
VASALESGADKNDDFGGLAQAFRSALADSGGGLNSALARVLELRVADWFQRAGQEDAAKEAARRAVELDPTHPESLGVLVELQRENPSAALVDTLLRVDSLSEGGLDALHEAAEVALEHAEGEIARQTLVRLYRKGARMWARSDRASGDHSPPETAIWALEKLVEHYESAGDLEEAVRLLLDGATLPLGADEARELRRRAAERLVSQGLRARAIELYASILSEAGDDMSLLARAAELCEQGNRVAELLALRHRELEITSDPDRKLELRLDLSRLSGLMEARGGRVEALLANLEESPGHPDSIRAVTEILVERGQPDRLADILESQATKLSEAASKEDGDEELSSRAAQLWGDVGQIAINETSDPQRAIAAYTKFVELAPSNEALDALAKLHLDADAPGEAARWLKARLEAATAGEKVAILLRLAKAQLQADDDDAAIVSLESAFSEAPRNGEIRKLLTGLYRTRNDWESLARVLSTAAQNVGDSNTVLAYAREAANIYHDRLGQPEMAVPVLEKALEIADEDRQLQSMLAEGLRVAGRLDEARTLLSALVEGFGRRRSSDRAAAHLQLARVLGEQGEMADAIDQLETASKMDSGNLVILKTLGELARRDGQFDRAERAYRTLLVQVRRAAAADLATAQTGPCTTLIELAGIARDRGQEDKSEELIESALEALAENDAEAEHVQAMLREREENALLRRVLDARLQYVEAPHLLGRLHAALADLIEDNDEDKAKALELRLEAVTADPGSPDLHDQAARLAGELGEASQYREKLEALIESTRRSGDAHVRCEVALRLGQELERAEDDAELERAADLYAMADDTGVRQVDVWRAMARVAGARGDSDKQVELLEKLASLGADQAETRADALYRMAEVHLATPDGTDAGLEALKRALADTPNHTRAAIVLARAAEANGEHDEFFDLYESVARKSAEPPVLLDFLEHNLQRPDVPLEHAREAAELAEKLEDLERGEAAMMRAVELAEDMIDGKSAVSWALLGLAERRRVSGDIAGSVKWLGEATDYAALDDLLATAAEVAATASQPDGDLTLAAKLYERLLERDSADRRIWEPLAGIYGQLGDIDQLERMVEETLDGLETTAERNKLRIELARALLGQDGRSDDAVEILRDAIMEAPEDMDAQLLLAPHLESTGDTEGLLDLLRNQLMAAQGRGKAEEIRIVSLQLIARLRETDPSEAVEVCRSALGSAPEDAELLRMMLELEGDDLEAADRIEMMQRLLAVEDSDHAAQLTAELVDLCNAEGDTDGAARALEIGYGRAPTDPELRSRLQASYREREDYGGLAQVLTDSAEAAEALEDQLALLREAATVHAEQLHSPSAAADLLRRCCELAPSDVQSRIALADALSSSLQHGDAVQALSELLETLDEGSSGRLELLRARAAIHSDAGDSDSALADLELAASIDLPAVLDALEVALQERRSSAMRRGEVDQEREVTLKLVELAEQTDRQDVARERLTEWAERDSENLTVWQRLREASAALEDWETVASCCTRMIALGDDDVIAEASIALAEACTNLGRPEDARAGLESARERQPDNLDLRVQLRSIYEQTGAHAELAALLLEDAEAAEDDESKLELLRRASALLSAGADLNLAIQTLTRILEVDPEDKLSIALLADTYVATQDLDAADALLDATIAGYRVARSPELSSFQHRKARVSQARGDRDSQLEHLKAAFAADKQNGPAAAELAVLAEEVEDWDLATRVLRGITVIEGPCPISRAGAFLRQGMISYRTGDVKRASFWARRARQEDPEFEEAQQFLDQLAES